MSSSTYATPRPQYHVGKRNMTIMREMEKVNQGNMWLHLWLCEIKAIPTSLETRRKFEGWRYYEASNCGRDEGSLDEQKSSAHTCIPADIITESEDIMLDQMLNPKRSSVWKT